MKKCRTCRREKPDEEFPRGEILGHQCQRCRRLFLKGYDSVKLNPKRAHAVYWVFIVVATLIAFQLAQLLEGAWLLLVIAVPLNFVFCYVYHCFVKKDYRFPFGYLC